MAIAFFEDEVRITMTAILLWIQFQICEIAIDFQTANKKKEQKNRHWNIHAPMETVSYSRNK